MTSLKSKIAVALGICVVGAAGVVAGTQLDNSHNDKNRTTAARINRQVAAETATTCTTPCVGQTATVTDPSFNNPAQAIDLITQAKVNLCATTISGVDYFANYTQYRGGYWYRGLGQLTLAQALSPEKAAYDDAGNNHIMLTTVSGKKYCQNKSRYAGGHWDQAFTILDQEATNLQNDQTSNPTITVK